MSKVSAHRHVTWAKQVSLGCLIASAAVLAGCNARATGDKDIVALADGTKQTSSQRESSSEHGTLDTVTGEQDPFLEPTDKAAAGSGGSTATTSTADAGSAPTSDAAAEEEEEDDLGADPALGDAHDVPRETVLFWVDAVSSRVWRANADGDGSDRRLLAGALSISAPDGITVDLTEGFVYWTNMGTPVGGAGVGSLQRLRLEDEMIETVIPVGTTSTPKQVNIDNQARQLYWSDRDSMVWRSELDGSQPELILSRHNIVQPAGMGLDVARRQMYITDRAAGRLYRLGFDMPEGATPENRPDVELLAVYYNPLTDEMPLNIALDLSERKLYWTDRRRGVIYKMNMDMPAGATPETREDIEIVVGGLQDPVGIALDDVTKRLYFTELSGRVSRVNLDGTNQEVILTTGAASGIALAHLPE